MKLSAFSMNAAARGMLRRLEKRGTRIRTI
jgi:hypothetical protein